jgi:hypothetical protein
MIDADGVVSARSTETPRCTANRSHVPERVLVKKHPSLPDSRAYSVGEATAALSFEEIEAEFGRHAPRKQQRP